MKRYVRSWLYVSGARSEHFSKALQSEADAVVFDLEDSVSESGKDSARGKVADFLSEFGAERLVLRINSPRTKAGRSDLAALAGCRLGAIRVPKVEGIADLEAVEDFLPSDCTIEVQPIIESAAGLANLANVLASPRVKRVCLGEGDLSADLGIDRAWFDAIRLDVVLTSRVADSWQPIQGVYGNVRDEDGLRASSEAGWSQGFFGRSVIHPAQVAIVNSAYTPTAGALAEARAVVEGVEQARVADSSAVVLPDGRFADTSTVKAAKRLLAIAAEVSRGEAGPRVPAEDPEPSPKRHNGEESVT